MEKKTFLAIGNKIKTFKQFINIHSKMKVAL